MNQAQCYYYFIHMYLFSTFEVCALYTVIMKDYKTKKYLIYLKTMNCIPFLYRNQEIKLSSNKKHVFSQFLVVNTSSLL